ncbi:phage tail sheath C-terminal domain-containing protein [Fibrobacter succinogenes]|uniref:phage tail sheath family protein n=1 Tax=Fibrobacter succinogenes TaxID=833 RepID=UPI001568A834|nr:phage tail sheath C-terminal domain-containing protein [Fibrobacter succinogenes]
MPTAYKTPGVYLVEKDAFPGSIVEVATAVPAFIGYTEKTEYNKNSLINKPVRITSFAEYLSIFGGAPSVRYTYKKDNSNDAKAVLSAKPAFRLYDSMRIFFQNGGTTCYICSVGGYTVEKEKPDPTDNTKKITVIENNEIDQEVLCKGITPFEKEQEPTLMIVPDAVSLADAGLCANVHTALLAHCNKMQNRFTILDVFEGFTERNLEKDCVADFREKVGTMYLNYGASYYPWVKTNVVSSNEVSFAIIEPEKDDKGQVTGTPYKQLADDLKISVLPDLTDDDYKDLVAATLENFPADLFPINIEKDFEAVKKTLDNVVVPEAKPDDPDDVKNKEKIKAQLNNLCSYLQKNKDLIKIFQRLSSFDMTNDDPTDLHNQLMAVCPAYVEMVSQMLDELNLMAPSAAMAGVYARVDNSNGVWKAPANVSINGVVSTAVNMTNEEQEDLNVPLNGKAVNAIRYFIGDGIKVWGARTLNGNSLDWRYINVRRTIIMLEESIKQACKAYVFENNTATTWLTMKNMIDNFLNGIWRRGGLAGQTPEDAYEVHVGLGDTMTAEDILEGYLRITVKVALIRPAEFIELTFQQLQQKS